MQHTKKVATFSSLFNKRLLFGGLFALLCTFALQAQTTRYVKATAAGTGDGSSWANASADLQAIINASAVNDQVWVAAGTYKPTKDPFGSASPADPRDKTFYVKDGVKIYGGFSASTPESTLAARNISTNVTTLSGDFNGDDVITGTGATLSITNNTENAYHVVLASAAAVSGGVGVTIDGFTITGGNANDANFTNITVNGNSIYRSDGGGIYTQNGTNTLSNNTLSGNAASNFGGGINTYKGTNTLSDNTLSGNSAGFGGGGILTDAGTNTISNNILSGNNTPSDGGGIYTFRGINTLSNNTLSGNAAVSLGGGIYTYYGTNMLSNNIFWGNKKGAANNVAGADYYAGGTNGNTFKNNLLQLAASSNYADANSNSLGTAPSGNLFNQDPLFVSATDLRLQATSPCINVGITGAGIPTTDITGTTRTGNPDLGAYEYFVSCPSGTTLHVNASVSGGTGDGTSWANAYASLGNALAMAHACSNINTIKVAAGTYKPTKKPFNSGTEMTTTDARDMTFHIPDGVTIEGGYNATTSSRDITANVTTLSGDFNSDDAVTGSGATLSITNNTENAYHVVFASAATSGVGLTIDGFTIKGGNANLSSTITVNGNSLYRSYGGGIYTNSGTNTLSNNTLSGNSATSGGGIFTNSGTNTLSNNTLSGNSATNGGGIFTGFATNTLSNNTLSGNSASSNGGGIYTFYGENTLSNNTLSGNSATTNGGGIYTNSGLNTLSNNIFWGNKKGAANNVAGADYYAFGTNGNTFQNNLLQLASSNYPVSATGNYAIGTGASDNLFGTDPLFVSATDLRLQATSPCINVGITGVGIPTKDITGTTRIDNPDLGAYEYISACTAPSITAEASSDSPICAGATLNLSVAASGTSLTYEWSGTGTFANGTTATPSVTGAATGNYVVTVSNSCGSVTSTAAVEVNAPLTTFNVTVTGGGVICPNGDVSINISGTQADAIYIIYKDGVDINQSLVGDGLPQSFGIVGLALPDAVGVYTVVAENSVAGCADVTMNGSVTVTEGAAPTANAGADATVTCTNPSTILSATGGGTYAWDNSATQGGTVSPSTTTTYTVTVTAANGCTATASKIVTVDKTEPTVNAGSDATVTCASPSTTLTATSTPPLGVGGTYAWNKGATQGGSVSPSVTTTYTVTATAANGCTATDAVLVTSTKNVPSLNAGADVTLTCTSPSTTLSATGTGTFSWNNGATQGGTVNPSISTVYGVTLTDADGCKATDDVSITVDKTAPTASIAVTNNCGNAVLSVTPPLGVGGTYVWSNAATTADITVSTSGTYVVTVTGSNGCTVSETGMATVKTVPTVTVTTRSPGCGSADINVGGGDTYAFSGSGTTTQVFTFGAPNPVSARRNVTSTGSYTVTVTNSQNCTATQNVNVVVNPAVTISLSKVEPACGPVVFTATGAGGTGTAPLTYAWSSNFSNVNGNTASLNYSGSYGVTVTDPSTGCIVSFPEQPDPNATGWGFVLVPYQPVNSYPTAYAVTGGGSYCSGGTGVAVELANSEYDVNYQLKKDGNNEGMAVSGTGSAISFGNQTAAGVYTVVATNATSACTASMTGSATVTVLPSPTANAGADVTLSCASPNTTLSATGTGTYVWNNGATQGGSVSPTVTTTYTVTVTAANGCKATDDVKVTPNPIVCLSGVLSGSTSICAGVSANLSVAIADGTAPFTVVLNNGTSDITVDNYASGSPIPVSPTTTRTYTFVSLKDNAGIVGVRSGTAIVFVDNIAPVITLGANITVTESTLSLLPTTVTATDAKAVVVTFTDVKVAVTPAACYTYKYNITRTWKATDACNNTATKNQLFVSQGIQVTCPADKTLNTNSDGTGNYDCSNIVKAGDNVNPVFLDNCSTSILKYTLSGVTTGNGNGTIAGIALNSGVTNVKYNLSHNGLDVCTFKVTILDAEAPKFGTMTNSVIDACNIPNPITMIAPSATDNCSGNVTLTPSMDVTATVNGCASKAATIKYIKSVTRTWTAADVAGNTSTAVQRMYIRDMQAPTAMCKDIIVTIGSSNISVLATQINNGSSDNCTATAALSYSICRNVGIVCTYASGLSLTPSMIPTGSNFANIPVTLRVTDACGNIGTCTATIRLQRVSTLANGNTNDNNATDLSITSDSKEELDVTPSTIDATHGSLKCFPNPFSDNLNLEYNLAKAVTKVTLKVYDNQGRLVTQSEQGEQLEGFYQVNWNLSDLQSGMYHVCLEIDGKCTKMERVIRMQ